VPELRAELSTTDAANGFGNQFLFHCVRRSKLLPFGGQTDPDLLRELGITLAAALADTRRGAIRFDLAARTKWAKEYPTLTADRAGMFGVLTAGTEAHTARLALLYAVLYAVLDGDLIGVAHLEAALAIMRHELASVNYIFGDSLGDAAADKILIELRQIQPDPTSRTRNLAAIQRQLCCRPALDAALGSGPVFFEGPSFQISSRKCGVEHSLADPETADALIDQLIGFDDRPLKLGADRTGFLTSAYSLRRRISAAAYPGESSSARSCTPRRRPPDATRLSPASRS
jgi:hypothetical protein